MFDIQTAIPFEQFMARALHDPQHGYYARRITGVGRRGDFTTANGDTSGRKVTMGAKSSVLIDTSGTANHVALVRVADSTLIYVTTCTSQALTANGSNTVNFPAWKIEIADPT